MRYSFKIASIKNIAIELHITFIVLLGLIFFLSFPYIYSFLLMLLLFVSVTIHELAHSLLAKYYGLKVRKIILYPIGGVSEIENIPNKPSIEWKVALIGPITSFIIGGFFIGLNFIFPLESIPTNPIATIGTGILLFDLGSLNIILGIFNSIPAFPMDGGRALRAFLAYRKTDFQKATEIAASVGRFFALIMLIIGFFSNFWLAIIGIFIYWGASQEVESARVTRLLEHVHISDVMQKEVISVDPTTTLADALEIMFKARIYDIIVCKEGSLVGVINWNDIIKIDLNLRNTVRVGELPRKMISINPSDSMIQALTIMSREKIQLLPVVDEHSPCNILGVITNQSIAYALELGRLIERSRIEQYQQGY